MASVWVKLGRQIFRNIRPWPKAYQTTTMDYISTIAMQLNPKHPKAYVAVYFLLQILLHYLFTFSVTNFSDLVNFKIRDKTKLNLIWDLILTVAANKWATLHRNDDNSCLYLDAQQCKNNMYGRKTKRLVTLDRKSVQQEWTEVFNTPSAQKEAENLHMIIKILLNKRCPQRVVKTNW